jgi:Protein of unknown function (DUF5132)
MARLARSLLLLFAGAAAGSAASTLLRRDGAASPTAKRVIKSGILFYDRLRGVVAEAGEAMSDLVAEAQEEIGAERNGKSGAASGEQVVPFDLKTQPEMEKKAHG